ncbi:hypothetical protein [Streptomyces sp. T028]|uniref:hypothetical protein n=1 Tax=Streptomyces sp. T028 TaxID=3394379 RepID=UPI003A890AE0
MSALPAVPVFVALAASSVGLRQARRALTAAALVVVAAVAVVWLTYLPVDPRLRWDPRQTHVPFGQGRRGPGRLGMLALWAAGAIALVTVRRLRPAAPYVPAADVPLTTCRTPTTRSAGLRRRTDPARPQGSGVPSYYGIRRPTPGAPRCARCTA